MNPVLGYDSLDNPVLQREGKIAVRLETLRQVSKYLLEQGLPENKVRAVMGALEVTEDRLEAAGEPIAQDRTPRRSGLAHSASSDGFAARYPGLTPIRIL